MNYSLLSCKCTYISAVHGRRLKTDMKVDYEFVFETEGEFYFEYPPHITGQVGIRIGWGVRNALQAISFGKN
jgi:hypothetical protein